MLNARGGHACTTADGALYAIGGFCHEALTQAEVFEPRVRLTVC
jgi:hypothetical protein